MVNMARGAYLKDLGNTPGHLNHWSKRSFVQMLSAPRRGGRGPLAVPVDDVPRPRRRLTSRARRQACSDRREVHPGDDRRLRRAPRFGRRSTREQPPSTPAATAAARASCRSASPRPGSSRSPTSRSRAMSSTPTSTARSRCCGRSCSSSSVGASTARSSSCSRARSPSAARAGSTAAIRCACRSPSRAASRWRSWRRRWRCTASSSTSSTARRRWLDLHRRGRRVRRELLRARLFRRPPVVRALRRARAVRVRLALLFPLAVAVGIASGQTAVALGILAAPFASLLVVPWAIARHRRLDAQAPAPEPR